MFGRNGNKGRHFTQGNGEKMPSQGATGEAGPSKDQTTKRIDLPPGVAEVVKFRFAEIVSCQEAMGVLASIAGQKRRSMFDYISKQTGIKMTEAQIQFDEKEVPFIEVYT
jgi:hypothetical protein